jgi:putative YphP/YqiW family bacilliredoxin
MSIPIRTMYDEQLVAPMREDLTRIGFSELRTASEVDDALERTPGTTLVMVNSVCGCSARMARPALRLALQASAVRPEHLTTVFAGQDVEATARARAHFTGYPPSSPSIALLKDGKLVFMMERWQIEGRAADAIARDLVTAFHAWCPPAG